MLAVSRPVYCKRIKAAASNNVRPFFHMTIVVQCQEEKMSSSGHFKAQEFFLWFNFDLMDMFTKFLPLDGIMRKCYIKLITRKEENILRSHFLNSVMATASFL